MNKQIVVCPQNRIQVSNNKENTADTKKQGWVSETPSWAKEADTKGIYWISFIWDNDIGGKTDIGAWGKSWIIL